MIPEGESMLTVLLNWFYIAITTFCIGCGVAKFSEKVLKYRMEGMDSLLMAGIAITTVYAQIFSLFGGVGMSANILLLIMCAGIVFFCRKEVKVFLEDKLKSFSVPKRIVLIVLVIVWAYFTSRGEIHYDTDLYHAQSIRWIEEYGVVPGLGNLHERFAYNSSFFAFTALYSMKFLLGESLHTTSGFFALVLTITVLGISKCWKEKQFTLSGFARVGAIYYLATITDEVVSPASDYSIMCVIFFIVIKWLDLLEEKKAFSAPYGLLCVLGAYALTLKLTAGLIIVLMIKPICLLIKEKDAKKILLYLCMGLLMAIPWFARTVMISGWLIYPFPALDLFEFDWEMSSHRAEIDAMHISAWGKALYDITRLNVPASEWIPNWFKTTLSGTEKVLILAGVCSIAIYLIIFIVSLLKKKKENVDLLLVTGVVLASYLFWQFSAPLFRYGYAYVLLLNFMAFGWILVHIKWKKVKQIVYFAVMAYGLYKVLMLGVYVSQTYLQPYYIWQAEYGTYEMTAYDVDGVTIYYPLEGDRAGYDYFPSTHLEVDVELRGDGLEDGFRMRQE